MAENNNKSNSKKQNNNETTDFEVSISDLDDHTTLVTSAESVYSERVKIAMAEYNPNNQKYSAYFSDNQSPSDDVTLDDVDTWATNAQTNLTNILQMNAYIRKLVNMNDIVGKVVESITTNINTEYKLTYNHSSTEGRNKKKKFAEAQNFIHEVNDSVNLKQVIRDCPTTAYTEGTYVCYLRHDDPNNYVIDTYPLGVVEITDYSINGNPSVWFNVQQLRNRLQKTYRKNKKNKALYFEKIDDEVKSNFPAEVYEAFKNGESYAVLDTKYTGVVRINHQNRKYGISPILRAIPDIIMLDQFRNADNINSKARAKKIIHQKMRKELIQNDPRVDTFPAQSYAHQNFCQSWAQSTVVVTSPPTVESIEYVEPSVEMTSVDTYNYYRSKVLTTLGISFLYNEGTSVSSASISVTQLMRTINSITEQLENILFRFYRQILIDNGYDQSFAPHISIIDSELMEQSLRKDMAVLYYSTLNTSLETAYAMAGLDIQDEYQKRLNEKELKYDEVFTPRMTAYTNSGSTNNTDNKSGAPEGDSVDTEGKKNYDKERNDAL